MKTLTLLLFLIFAIVLAAQGKWLWSVFVAGAGWGIVGRRI
jgi:hypothetical protein